MRFRFEGLLKMDALMKYTKQNDEDHFKNQGWINCSRVGYRGNLLFMFRHTLNALECQMRYIITE